MITWQIEYFDANQGGISFIEIAWEDLTKEQFKSIAKELKLLEICGNTLKLPHSKALGNGLFELRERKFGYRIYYTFFKDKVIVLLHTGCKACQNKDIKIARKRLLELLQGEKI